MTKSSDRSIKILLFVILLFSFVYFLPRWADWGTNSRLNLTLAIVEQGTLSIDDYYQNTGDYAHFEGHYYLDKAPGPSFLAVPVYALTRPILNLKPARAVLNRPCLKWCFFCHFERGRFGSITGKNLQFSRSLFSYHHCDFNSIRFPGGDDFFVPPRFRSGKRLERSCRFDLCLGNQRLRLRQQF